MSLLKMMRYNLPWMIVILQTIVIIYFFPKHQETWNDIRGFPFPTGFSKNGSNRLNRLARISNFDETIFARLDELISRRADSRDPELIQLVRELMDPPSTSHLLKLSRQVYKTPQARIVDDHLNLTGGFFVEVGGFDGERSSNTLYLESKRNWNGLLIEADPFFYTQLIGKNRRAWSINACLSPTDYVSKLKFKESNTGQGRVELEDEVQNPNKDDNKKLSLFSVDMVIPCFPLETMLLVLNEKNVNFFSLDVEGVELEILESLNFERIHISTLAVEFMHGNKTAYKEFMINKGYYVLDEVNVVDNVNFLFANDFIFAKA